MGTSVAHPLPEPDFRAIGALIARHWKLIVGLPVAVALAIVAISMAHRREYTASASFVAENAPASSSSFNQLTGALGISLGSASAATSPQFYADLVTSRDILVAAVNSPYKTSGAQPFAGTLVQYFKNRFGDISNPTAAASKLRESISVVADRATGVIRMTVTLPDADIATQVARRLVDLVNDYNLNRRQSQARSERELTEQRVADSQRQLQAAQDELTSFMMRNRRYSDSPELLSEYQRLQSTLSLRQSLYISLVQHYETVRLDELRSTPAITIVETPEGSAAPASKGTVRKAVVGFVLALFLAVPLAFGAEYSKRGRKITEPFGAFLGTAPLTPVQPVSPVPPGTRSGLLESAGEQPQV